jgi:V/A-type H+-transporting ATPase subunit A
MMKVVGEEGTSLHDFIVYLKGEFLDSVYLQQNAFDEVDAATVEERQKYVFHAIHEILQKDFNLESKDLARKFFQSLVQRFIEWNSIEYKSDDFSKKEKEIKAMVEEKARREVKHAEGV